jgi:hypothetical protein
MVLSKTLTSTFTPACWQLYHLLIYGSLYNSHHEDVEDDSGVIEMDIELETYVEQVMDEQKISNGIDFDFGFSKLISTFVYGVGLYRGSIDERQCIVFESRRV